MPSKYHPKNMGPDVMAAYLKALLHAEDKKPICNEQWDYKKWIKENKTMLETEKQLHFHLLELGNNIRKVEDAKDAGFIEESEISETKKVNKYSPLVKVGNWQEERDVAEEDLNRFLRLRGRGQLMVQKTREIIGQNLRPITMPPKKTVRFGDKVQLIARHATTYKGRGKQEGLSLSCVLTGHPTAEMCLPIIEGTILSASPLIAPCIRNVFELLPWEEDDAIRRDGRLKFGQPFVLRYIGTSASHPYYVSVNPKRIIPSGNNSLHSEVFLHSRKCWANVWKAYNGLPNLRKESMGQPISGNQDIIVTSANINRSLCCETDSWFTTFFGIECEATAFTYYNVYGAETVNNVWSFN